jgi:hypothetical protein
VLGFVSVEKERKCGQETFCYGCASKKSRRIRRECHGEEEDDTGLRRCFRIIDPRWRADVSCYIIKNSIVWCNLFSPIEKY